LTGIQTGEFHTPCSHTIQLHTVTGHISFKLVFGYQAMLPSALISKSYSYNNYAKELKERLRTTNRIAKEHIIKAKLTVKQQYDKDIKAISFKLGDKVLLHDSAKSRLKKLDSL